MQRYYGFIPAWTGTAQDSDARTRKMGRQIRRLYAAADGRNFVRHYLD